MPYQTIIFIFWGTILGALLVAVFSVTSFGMKQRIIRISEQLELFLRLALPPVRTPVPVKKIVTHIRRRKL
ncbi:MAG: hypothetical protein JXX29_19195 [Deltaproteobacteria bacterium]|nr:hypothetical protein [Deltaproteobacteria bacterium]MBN2673814.1 hypothetical protein [Deltaproteobacteria bacterium]